MSARRQWHWTANTMTLNWVIRKNNFDQLTSSDLDIELRSLESNRLISGLCPTIQWNFIKKIWSAVWVILLADRQKDRHRWKHNPLFGDNNSVSKKFQRWLRVMIAGSDDVRASVNRCSVTDSLRTQTDGLTRTISGRRAMYRDQ